MDQKQIRARRAALGLFIVAAVSLLTLLILAGCSVGPFNFDSGPAPTPTPSGPTATSTPLPRALIGTVSDMFSGKPLGGAQVIASGILTETNPDGRFYFDDVGAASKISVQADGYAGVEVDTGTGPSVDVKLRPDTISGRVTDATTGKPLAGVLVKLVLPSQDVTGTTSVTPTAAVVPSVVPTGTATSSGGAEVQGPGLAAPRVLSLQAMADTSSDDSTAAVTDTPVLTGTTMLPSATPTPKPTPPTGPGFVAVYTNDDGTYSFKDVPQNATLTFKMPGYKLTKVPADSMQKDMALQEFRTEAIYITAEVASDKGLRDKLIKFATSSRINAVVLNVQDQSAQWVFDTQNPDVVKANTKDVFFPGNDLRDLVQDLKSKGLYTIARIVTFQQKSMAEARPDWCIRSSASGQCWKGGYKGAQMWLDGSNPAVQDYVVSMTKEVIALGFDEIQYDYVRFPSDPATDANGNLIETGDPVLYIKSNQDMDKVMALQSFLKKAHDTIEPTDAFMSIDVFGYSLWPDRDGKPILGVIGQVLPYLLDDTDYASPMIYPSHFSQGEMNCDVPAACAYKLVDQAGKYAANIFKGKKAKYRPWLQDFDWPPVDYTSEGTTKVQDQIDACQDTGCWGWQWWDASNTYEPRSAFMKK